MADLCTGHCGKARAGATWSCTCGTPKAVFVGSTSNALPLLEPSGHVRATAAWLAISRTAIAAGADCALEPHQAVLSGITRPLSRSTSGASCCASLAESPYNKAGFRNGMDRFGGARRHEGDAPGLEGFEEGYLQEIGLTLENARRSGPVGEALRRNKKVVVTRSTRLRNPCSNRRR